MFSMMNVTPAAMYAAGQAATALVGKVPFSTVAISDDGRGALIDLGTGELQRRLVSRSGRVPGEITPASRKKLASFAASLMAGDHAIERCGHAMGGSADNDNSTAARGEVMALAVQIFPKKMPARERWLASAHETAAFLLWRHQDEVYAVASALSAQRSLSRADVARLMRERISLDL